MIFRNAVKKDIEGIMLIERQAFIPQIQEEKEVFEQRLSVYPAGFFVLEDELKQNTILGYFSTEIWKDIPKDRNSFILGHSAKKSHIQDGNILYLSSIALLNQCKGKGLGQMLFEKTIQEICTHNKHLTQAVLLVNETWKNAYKMYQKNGFNTYGKLDKFFLTQDENVFTDGILMQKDLCNL